MDKKDFLENFLQPSGANLNQGFTHPLPDIEGLTERGCFIIQSELEDTFSTNIIRKYVSDISGVIVKEVYKNTQNKKTGAFVRLVGTIGYVKNGYPRLVVDAPISNVKLLSGERNDLETKVYIVFPQANAEQKRLVFQKVQEQVEKDGISLIERKSGTEPDNPPSTCFAESDGIDFSLIEKLRNHAWQAYKYLIQQTEPQKNFDYKPMLHERIFNTSRKEALSFSNKGLSVPAEVQAAFFSVTTSGIE